MLGGENLVGSTGRRRLLDALRTALRRPVYDPLQGRLSLEQSEKVLAACARRPLFSLVAPVAGAPVAALRRAVHSVKAQHSPRWELLLVDRGSSDSSVAALLDGAPAADDRVRVLRLREDPGVAGAANAGVTAATGEFIALLDPADELAPDALTWCTWAANEHPNALWFYSDEDQVDEDGVSRAPHFKPDFDPLLLLCSMYTRRLSVCAASALAQVGGLRPGFGDIADYELALRLAEFVPRERVVHIPRVLDHRRTARAPAAASPAAGDPSRAVTDALARRGVQASAAPHPLSPALTTLSFSPARPATVALLVQSPAAPQQLERCLAALERGTSYTGYEVVVLDRPPKDGAALNHAIEALAAEYVVLLDGNAEIVTPAWLEQLVGAAQAFPGIAGVGAVVADSRRRVVHAGVVLGMGDLFDSAHRGEGADSLRCHGHLQCLRETAAISTVLGLFSRETLLGAGGFESGPRPSLLSDVALCAKLRRAGFTVAIHPGVRAVARGAALAALSPGADVTADRPRAAAWRAALGPDPHYNPNFLLRGPSHRPGRHFPPETQIGALGASP